MNVDAGLQLPDLKGIARRRAPVALGVALVVSLAGYWLAMALPNEYESYATVLVEPQAVAPELVEAGVPKSDLNRRLHLMAAEILSRPRLSKIIDDFGLYKQESRYLVRDEVINHMRDQVRVEPVVPEMEQQQARARTDFEIDQFRIYFRDNDPVVARDVAQRLANDFIERHIADRVETSQKSVEFVESELSRLAQAIQDIEGRVAQVKNDNPGRLPENAGDNQRRLERIISDLTAARREEAAARSDEAFYRSQGATARILTDSQSANSPEARIEALQAALADFDARGYTEKHPDRIKAQTELDALKAQIKDHPSESSRANFAQQSAEAEAERARLRREHAEQEIAHLDQQAAEVQELLASIPRVAEQLDGLEREYRHLFESYQEYSNKRLEAGVQADLERRQLGEQFRVLEAAFLAPGPTSPNRPMIMLIAVIFGVAMGGGVGVVLEAADPTIHTTRQLQSTLGLPVLGAIPQIWLEADRVHLRRRRLRAATATAALVVFSLVGGAVNYWWVNGSASGTEAPARPSAAPVAPIVPGEPVPPRASAPAPAAAEEGG